MNENDQEQHQNSCDILGLSCTDPFTEAVLKRQYRKMALIYHPDKNHSEDASENFRKVQTAYEFLMKWEGYMDDDTVDDYMDQNTDNKRGPFNQQNIFHYLGLNADTLKRGLSSYPNLLATFIEPILQSEVFQEITARIFHVIIESILDKCEEKTLMLLKRLDKRVFYKVRAFLRLYSEVLHLSDVFLDKIDREYDETVQQDQCIILSPFLDDLFQDNLYRLTENGNVYLVPLWHHELVYDNSGADLYIQCIPILPDGIEIDEDNHLHVYVEVGLDELWSKPVLDIVVGTRFYQVARDQLFMKTHQTIVLEKCGISCVNTASIYDISRRANIYVHLHILGP
jgi:hypothetical protein